MEQLVTIRGRVFKPLISREAIAARVKELANSISKDHEKVQPLFLAVLNGSFMFAADLLKEFQTDCQISFIKVSSYSGMNSEDNVSSLIGLSEDVQGRTIILLEDIVDSGLTIEKLKTEITGRGAAEVKTATMLFKPGAFKGDREPDYTGFKIENDFVIGYGMDYDGSGRNLDSIYVLA